jgi:hypothetical protein
VRFSVDGFSWEATRATGSKPLPSRAEATAALERVHHPATSTSYYRAALAAFSVCDYGRVLACCEAAAEAGSPERWT